MANRTAHRPWAGAALTLALLGALLAPRGAAMAQERYRLQEGQWQKQAAHPPDSPEGKLQAIRKAKEEERLGEALDLADGWIEQYPNHARLVEAHFLRGDIQVARGQEYQALFDYEYVLREFPASEQFTTALEREYEIARLYASGLRRRLWGMRLVWAGDEAAEIFIRIQERAPGSEIGEKASLALGDYYFGAGEMLDAVDGYDMFLVNYPRSLHRERVMLRLIQANLATFKGPRFDARGLLEAAHRLRSYQREFPAGAERIGAGALLVRIDEAMARKTLYQARWYQGQGDGVAAVFMYQRVVRDQPRTSAAHEALAGLKALKAPAVAPREAPLEMPPATAPATQGGRP